MPRITTHTYRPAPHFGTRWLSAAKRSWQASQWSLPRVLQLVFGTYINALLVFVPLALAAAGLSWKNDVVFAFSFLAIVPLSGLVHYACEDLSASLNHSLGRLLVAFSDDIVELMVGIVALSQGQTRLVQRNLMGSVLCYSLLVSDWNIPS